MSDSLTNRPRYPEQIRRFKNSVFARLTEESLSALKVTVYNGGFFDKMRLGGGRSRPLFPCSSPSPLSKSQIALESFESDDRAEDRAEDGDGPE
jgi:hypothetical protein